MYRTSFDWLNSMNLLFLSRWLENLACALGILTPETIKCTESVVAAQKTREIEYLSEVEFVSSSQDVASILSAFNKINEKFGRTTVVTVKPAEESGSYYQHVFGNGRHCGMPKKDGEKLTYRWIFFLIYGFVCV